MKPKYKYQKENNNFRRKPKYKFWKENKNFRRKPKYKFQKENINFGRKTKILDGNQKFWKGKKKCQNEI